MFGAFTLSIIQGLQSLSQDSLQAPIWFFSIAVSALALYSLRASHSQYPLFALSLFRLRSFSVGISGSNQPQWRVRPHKCHAVRYFL